MLLGTLGVNKSEIFEQERTGSSWNIRTENTTKFQRILGNYFNIKRGIEVTRVK